MSEQSSKKTGDRSHSAWVSTVPRCHALGASLSIGIILATAWVLSLGHAPASTVNCGDQEIDLGEAIALIENANQWHELAEISEQDQKQIDLRTNAISAWLPESVEFAAVENALLELAEELQLHVFSIQEGERQVGQRVAVLTVSCEAQGSFAALCRFLHHLPTLPQPMACSELTLQRADTGLDFGNDFESIADDQPCRVSVFLRIPYTAPDTASWKLLKEPRHAI